MPDEELGEGNEYTYMYDLAEAGTAREVTVPGNQTWTDVTMAPGKNYVLVLRTISTDDSSALSQIKLYRFAEFTGMYKNVHNVFCVFRFKLSISCKIKLD